MKSMNEITNEIKYGGLSFQEEWQIMVSTTSST